MTPWDSQSVASALGVSAPDGLRFSGVTTDTRQLEPGTLFVSQPAPKSGDLPNDPALGILDPHTGVVTHVDSTMGSPKGLLFVPEHGDGSDGE